MLSEGLAYRDSVIMKDEGQRMVFMIFGVGSGHLGSWTTVVQAA